VLVASFSVPFGLLTLLSAAFILSPDGSSEIPHGAATCASGTPFTRWPGILALTLVIQLSAMRFLGFPLRSASPTRTSDSSCWS
jgi:hypothetical protein